MGFFDLLKKQRKMLGKDDNSIAGIIDESDVNNEVVVENVGNEGEFGEGFDGDFVRKTQVKQSVTPNIPTFRIFPSTSIRYNKSNSYINRLGNNSGSNSDLYKKYIKNNESDEESPDRKEHQNRPLQLESEGRGKVRERVVDNNKGSGMQSAVKRKAPTTEDILNDIQANALNEGEVNPQSQKELSNLFGVKPNDVMSNVLYANNTGKGKDKKQSDTDLPNQPEYQTEPTGAETITDKSGKVKPKYKSSKWKDILIGMLSNLGQVDMNKINPNDRVGAFLGALAGGATEGAITKDFVGNLKLESDRRKVREANARKRKEQKELLDLEGDRVQITNAKLKPILDQQKLELDKITKEKQQAISEGRLSVAQGQLEIKQAQSKFNNDLALAKHKFAQEKLDKAMQSGWTKAYKLGADGQTYLTVLTKEGKEIPLTTLDGTGNIRVVNPNEWNLTKLEIDSAKDEAESKVTPLTTGEITQKSLELAKQKAEGLGLNWDEMTSRRKIDLQKEAERSIRQDEENRVKQQKSQNRAKAGKQVIQQKKQTTPRKGSKVTDRIRNSVNNTNFDIKSQFNSSQKGNPK